MEWNDMFQLYCGCIFWLQKTPQCLLLVTLHVSVQSAAWAEAPPLPPLAAAAAALAAPVQAPAVAPAAPAPLMTATLSQVSCPIASTQIFSPVACSSQRQNKGAWHVCVCVCFRDQSNKAEMQWEVKDAPGARAEGKHTVGVSLDCKKSPKILTSVLSVLRLTLASWQWRVRTWQKLQWRLLHHLWLPHSPLWQKPQMHQPQLTRWCRRATGQIHHLQVWQGTFLFFWELNRTNTCWI